MHELASKALPLLGAVAVRNDIIVSVCTDSVSVNEHQKLVRFTRIVL